MIFRQNQTSVLLLVSREAIKDLPDDLDHEVSLYKAKILIEQSQGSPVFAKAMKYLNKASSFPGITSENKAEILRQFSRIYKDKGFIFKVRKEFEKAHKEFEEALKYAEEAIVQDWTFWSAHNAKAIALRHLDRIDDAIEVLEDIIKEDDKYEQAYYNLACYLTQKIVPKPKTKIEQNQNIELKEKALSKLTKAIKLEPKNKREARKDLDFDPIRKEKAFEILVQEEE
jgi:tetratricopeptide (TPR) repeat protein